MLETRKFLDGGFDDGEPAGEFFVRDDEGRRDADDARAAGFELGEDDS